MPFSTSHPRFDMIVCDIDGCLSPESSTPFDLDNLALVARHNRLAVERRDRPLLTLCSGRPQPFAEAMCRLLANTTLPCICENGVWMYHAGTNTYDMDPGITTSHLRAVRDAADWLLATFGHGSPAAASRGPVTQQPGKAASVSLYHPDPAYLREICPTIERECAARSWPLRISMTWFYINCDLKHISKGTGVERLLTATGIPRSRACGIGDTPGDLPIAERVSAFFAPANCAEAIRPAAAFIAPSPETRGVLDILHHIGP
jgi:hydroxymethylpyrimidine pyrophosphatase-like HAD family hydrolase